MVVLPTVFLVMLIGIGAFSAQLAQLGLVSSASSIARALATEDSNLQDQLIAQLDSSVGFEIIEDNSSICVVLSRKVIIPGMDFEIFQLSEQQCAGYIG